MVKESEKTEKQLISRACNGDRHAFRQLVEMHQKTVFYLCYDLCGSIEDAEDLSQEVFVKMFRNLSSFKGNSLIKTWLYRVTVNVFLDRRRSKAGKMDSRKIPLEDYHRNETLTSNSSLTSHPEKQTEIQQIRSQVDTALGILSPRERTAFTLRHYQELPIREVAATMGLKEGSVKSLLFRGANKLRDFLSPGLQPRARGGIQ